MNKKINLINWAASLGMAISSQADLVYHWTFDTDGSNDVGGINMLFNSNAFVSEQCSTVGAGSVRVTNVGAPAVGGAVTESAIDWSAFANGDERTIAFWGRMTDPQLANSTMFSAGVNANGQRLDIKINGGNYRVEVQGGGFSTSENIVDDTWHHYAVVLPSDGATMGDFLYYLDGALIDTSANTQTRDVATATAILRIGDSAIGGGGRDLEGHVDDVRIYDNALTITEIQALVDGGRVARCFAASDDEIIVGQTVDLSWEAFEYSALIISNNQDATTVDAGATGDSGSVSLSPAVTTVYTLTGTPLGGGVDDVRQLTVQVKDSPDVNTFTDSPALVYGVGTVTLDWTTISAGRIEITDDQGSPALVFTASGDTQAFLDAGTVDIPAVSTTTVYTLTATLAEDGTGSASQLQTTAEVQAGPDITLVAVPAVTDGTQNVTLYFNATVLTSETEEFSGMVDASGFNAEVLTDSNTDFDTSLTAGQTYFLRRDSGDNTGGLTSVVSWSGNDITLAENISDDLTWFGDYTILTTSFLGADSLVINDGSSDIVTITDPAVIANGSFDAGVVAASTTYTATASISGAGSSQDSATVDTTGTGSSYEEVVLSSSPVGYYRFEESFGSAVVFDSSGNENHSTAIDNAQFFTSGSAGAVGNGGIFAEPAAVGASVVTGVTLDPSATDWSITGLVRASDLFDGNANIVSNRDGAGGTGRSLLYLDAGDSSLTSFVSGGASPDMTASVDENASLLEDAWCHIAVTYNSTNNTIRFYLDGGLDGEQADIMANSASGAWVLGAQKVNQGGNFWDGILDEFAIFDSELSAADVTAQNNAFLTDASGLLAFGRDATIEAGQSAELFAKLGSGITAASIDNGVGTVPSASSTSFPVSPVVTTTYTIDVDGVTQSVTITVLPPSTATITSCGFDGSGNFFIDVAEGVAGFKVTTSPDLATAFVDAAGVTDDGANRFTINAANLDGNGDDSDFFRVESE